MKILLFSFASLLALVKSKNDFIDHKGVRQEDKTEECKKAADLFREDYGPSWKFCLNDGDFSDKSWPGHSASIFEDMNPKKIPALLYWLSNSSEPLIQNWESNMNSGRVKIMKERLSRLSAQDINNMHAGSLKASKIPNPTKAMTVDTTKIVKELESSKDNHLLHLKFEELEKLINALDETKSLDNIKHLYDRAFPKGYNPATHSNLEKSLEKLTDYNETHLKEHESTLIPVTGACKQLSPIMKYLENYDNLVQVDSECFSELLTSLQGKSLISKIDKFSDELFKEKSAIILEYLQKDSDNRFKYLSNDTLRRMLAFDDICSSINEKGFSEIIKSKERAASLNPTCIKNLSPEILSRYAYGKNIQNLPLEFYYELEDIDLHDDFYAYSTKDQIANWGIRDSPILMCLNLKVPLLTSENISLIRPDCFLNAIKADSSRLRLGEKWKDIQTNVFSIFTKDDLSNTMEALTDSDLQAIKSPQRQYFFNSNCQKVKPSAITSDIKVDRTCFESMNGESQATVLVRCKELDENLLINITKENMSSWSASKNNDFRRGIEVLLLLGKINQRIIKNLSANVTDMDQHACNDLEFSRYQKLKKIHSKIPEKCLALIIKGDGERKWSPREVKTLIKEKEFYKNPKIIDIMEQLKNDDLSSINADCISNIQEKHNLSDSIITKLEPSSFRKLRGQDYSSIRSKLTPEQFGQVGVDIDGTESALESVEASDLTDDRIPKLSVDFMSRIRPKVYKAFSTTNIKLVPPTSLARTNKLRAQELDEKVLMSLSVEQINHLGINVKDEADSPIHLFTKDILAGMSAEQNQAVQNRRIQKTSTQSAFSFKSAMTPMLALLMLTLI